MWRFGVSVLSFRNCSSPPRRTECIIIGHASRALQQAELIFPLLTIYRIYSDEGWLSECIHRQMMTRWPSRYLSLTTYTLEDMESSGIGSARPASTMFSWLNSLIPNGQSAWDIRPKMNACCNTCPPPLRRLQYPHGMHYSHRRWRGALHCTSSTQN